MAVKPELFSERWISSISLILLALLGLWLFWDYGISTDEAQQRLIGQTSLKYLTELLEQWGSINGATNAKSPSDVFLGFRDSDYGVAFELPAELFIKLLGISSNTSAYYFRHALTFLIFLGAVVSIYSLAKIRYSSWKWGWLAAAFLVLTPRIFGDSFFNDKDLVFLSFFSIAFFTLVRFLIKPTWQAALWHALACGVAIDIRIMAIILPVATIVVSVLLIIKNPSEIRKRSYLLILFLVALAPVVLIFWPWLWSDPINHLIQAFSNMSKFRWGGQMIFMGEVINSEPLPWYYIPVWIGVTTPIVYLYLFVTGAWITSKNFFKSKWALWRNLDELQDTLTLGLAISPILAVVLLDSVLYNGWRHLYFIYPAFILVSLRGLYGILSWAKGKKLIWDSLIKLVIILSLIANSIWMIRNHPYQYLYFNYLAGNWVKTFDVDYWGVAYRRPLEKILKNNPDQIVTIFNDMKGLAWGLWQIPYWTSVPILDYSDQIRIDGSQTEACSDFVITSQQGNATQYSLKNEFQLIDQLKVDGRVVYATFQRKIPLRVELSPELDKTIYFSNHATQCLLKEGWVSRAEDWGAWSLQKSALLELPIPTPFPVELELNLRAFVNPKHPLQRVLISIENGKPREFILTKFNDNIIRLDLKKSSKEAKLLRIRLELPNAVSPRMLDLGSDDRQLAVGLVSARFLK